MRTGIIARKLGMSRVFEADGRVTPVTLLVYEPCYVTDVKTQEKNGYQAVQLATAPKKAKNVSQPERGHFARAKVAPQHLVREFRVDSVEGFALGQHISIEHLVPGQYVDVRGVSIGKGFAGAMKRHNFGGLRASHGVSVSHRSHGSTGQRQDPGRVFKGKKMAGHLGAENVVIQNLVVQGIDAEKQLILIKGAVPGSKGSFVTLTDAVKLPSKMELPHPTVFFATEKVDNTPANEAQVESVQVDEAVVEAAPAIEPTNEE